MISHDLAERLKEAGLPWNVALYDFCYYQGRLYAVIFVFADKVIISPGVRVDISECIFAPRLDQLLAEIERRGYGYDLHTLTTNHEHKYYCAIKLLECACGYRIDNISWGPFKGDTPEVAVGNALLWILEREKE